MEDYFVGNGLSLMGYFLGKGIQNIGHLEKSNKYNFLIKENDLEFYINLNKPEIEELLSKYPNAPKIELKDTKYYPYNQFMEWISTIDTFQ